MSDNIAPVCISLVSTDLIKCSEKERVVTVQFVQNKYKPSLSHFPGEDEELGPPPSVDEAADALMTRLGFLLGEKAISGEPGSSYHAQDDGQVISSHTHTHLQTARLSLPSQSVYLVSSLLYGNIVKGQSKM